MLGTRRTHRRIANWRLWQHRPAVVLPAVTLVLASGREIKFVPTLTLGGLGDDMPTPAQESVDQKADDGQADDGQRKDGTES